MWYAPYIPEALITEPARVRSVLILVPGGNGGRTRYFLTPIPRKTIWHKMTGGLEIKRLVDEFLASSPETVPPIVVAVNGPALSHINGFTEFFVTDMPRHVVNTYLGGIPVEAVALGVEGISSGSRTLMKVFRTHPASFQTLGLTCMHCRRFNGIDPDKHLGTEAERDLWLSQVAVLAKAGLLHIRFSVGNRDNQWKCNKEFHDLFVAAGALSKGEPRYDRCRKKKDVGQTW
jgi:hypothetical protein